MLSPLTSMAVYSASTLTVIVIVETSRVIGLSLLGLRMASKSAGLITGLVVIEPGGTLLESVIMFTSSQGVDTSVVVGLGRDVVVVATVVPKDKNITKLYRSSILSKV